MGGDFPQVPPSLEVDGVDGLFTGSEGDRQGEWWRDPSRRLRRIIRHFVAIGTNVRGGPQVFTVSGIFWESSVSFPKLISLGTFWSESNWLVNPRFLRGMRLIFKCRRVLNELELSVSASVRQYVTTVTAVTFFL